MKIQYVIAMYLIRWLTNFDDFRFKWTATAGIVIHPTKTWLSQLVNFKNPMWTLEERYAIKFCFKLGKMPCDESWIYCYDTDTKRQSSQWKHTLPDQRRPDRTNLTANIWWSLFWLHWHDLHALGSHWTDNQQGILCLAFKGVQEEIPSEEASTFKSSQWHFHQDNALVHNFILVTDYLTKMGINIDLHPP